MRSNPRLSYLTKRVALLGVILLGWSHMANAEIAIDNRTIDDRGLVSRFLEQAQAASLPAETWQEIQRLAQQKQSAADLITAGLMQVYPEYREAVNASDNDDINAARAKLGPLVESKDQFLAADAAFYLARVLINHERFEEALPLLEKITTGLTDYATHQASSRYFTGMAYAGLLKNEEAVAALIEFLQMHDDAPERLRVSAWRQVQHLQTIQAETLEDVHQRMDFSRRRLDIAEPSGRTQEEQDKIVSILAKLIKEAEKKECSGGSCKNPSESQQQQQQQSQNQPQQNSESQKGGQSNVANGQFVDRRFDMGDNSAWSRLRDRSRDPANMAIKDKLPARYRDIVERYMDAVNNNQRDD